jgi:hypothetical protein
MIKISVCQDCEFRGPADNPPWPMMKILHVIQAYLDELTLAKYFLLGGRRGILFKILLKYGAQSCLFEEQINHYFLSCILKIIFIICRP